MKTRYLFILFLISFTHQLFGRNSNEVMFKHLNIKENLSHYSVMALYQDERGLIWMGTRNGVNVYDGNEIHIYKQERDNPHSIVSNSVRDITGNRQGEIYFLTIRGISRYNIEKEEFTTLTQKPMTAMFYDKQLYVGVENKVYVHNGNEFLLCYELPETTARIFSLNVSNDSLLIGTEGQGMYIYHRRTEILTHPIAQGKVSEIFKDSHGRYWIGTWEEGIYLLHPDGRMVNHRYVPSNPFSICSNFIRKCREDKQGNIWIGTFSGLSKYSDRDETFVNYLSSDTKNGLTHASVWSLLCDHQGTMWVGTYFGGVDYFNPQLDFYKQYIATEHEGEGLSFGVVGEMTEDSQGNLWICTEGGGLNKLNRTTGHFKWYRHTSAANSISHNNVKSIYYDPKREVMWIGTHLGGLNKLDLRTERFTRYSNIQSGQNHDKANIVCDIIPYQESLLLATHNGVYRFDIAAETFTPMFKSGAEGAVIDLALDLKIDHKGLLWIAGVENGVYVYDFVSQKLTPHRHTHGDKNGISNNGVSSIYPDKEGRLWLCMGESGLDLYNYAANTFRNFNEKQHGLLSNCVYGACLLSSDKLLIITDNGFSYLDIPTETIRNFDTKSGLPLAAINQNALYQTADGEIFIGGIDGMISFRPEDLETKSYPYELFPYKLYVNDKEVKVGDESGILSQSLSNTPKLTLRANQSMFSILYAMTDYMPLNRNDIMYKLENFSDTWTTMRGGRMITYTNLNPGKYTLLVKTNPKAGQTASVSTLEIEVLPPFYRTTAAILLYLLVIAVLLFIIVRVYKNRVKLQAELKYERKHIQDIENLNQHKLRFFTNISHEFRTPLTLIIGQMEMLLQVRNFAPSVYNKILSIYKSGLQLQELITELLDFRKQEQGHMKLKVTERNIVDFLYENFLLFREYAVHRKISLMFNKTNDSILVWYDAKQMQKVVNNLLSNAFQYTPEGGEIALSVRKGNNREVIVEVSDSGSGIDSKDLDKIFDRFYQTDHTVSASQGTGIGIGLALTKGIIELHHGTIGVFSTPGEGTTFAFSLPLGKEHFSSEEISQEEVSDFVPAEPKYLKYERMEDVSSVEEEDELERKILIVEDETDLRNMLVDIFKPFYTVVTTDDGTQALQLAIDEEPDIILTDILIPGMSGIELCKCIKENVAICHIPVMMLTARTTIEHKLEGLQTGADDYIIKPFDVNILLARCKNLINNRIMLQEKFSKQPRKSAQLFATTVMDKEFMDRAMKIIEEHIGDTEFNMNFFAREMGVARTKLFSRLKAITGQTPNDLVLSIRMKRAAYMLKNNYELNISEISNRLGFCSPRYFSRCFKERYNVTPQVFRKEDSTDEEEQALD
ncbi:MAG: response regulator [Bacteroides sp.]|nr:response regulator [Bacteroides sp.]